MNAHFVPLTSIACRSDIAMLISSREERVYLDVAVVEFMQVANLNIHAVLSLPGLFDCLPVMCSLLMYITDVHIFVFPFHSCSI